LKWETRELKLQGTGVKKAHYSFGQVLENVALISDEKKNKKKMRKHVAKRKIDLQHGYF